MSSPVLPQALESIGLSGPTIARLKTVGIESVAQLVQHEENLTISLITQAQSLPRTGTERLVSSLPLSPFVFNRILEAEMMPVGKLLSKSSNELLKCRSLSFISLAHIIVCLIDEGYSDKDGLFLTRGNILRYLTYTGVYATFVRLEEKGKLSTKFKQWFNGMIKDIEPNAANRSNRKIHVKPFKIKQ